MLSCIALHTAKLGFSLMLHCKKTENVTCQVERWGLIRVPGVHICPEALKQVSPAMLRAFS